MNLYAKMIHFVGLMFNALQLKPRSIVRQMTFVLFRAMRSGQIISFFTDLLKKFKGAPRVLGHFRLAGIMLGVFIAVTVTAPSNAQSLAVSPSNFLNLSVGKTVRISVSGITAGIINSATWGGNFAYVQREAGVPYIDITPTAPGALTVNFHDYIPNVVVSQTYNVVEVLPRVSSIRNNSVPSQYSTSAPSSGGSSISISGERFSSVRSVTIGGVPATAYTVNNSTSITATVPAGTPGSQAVIVTTAQGASNSNIVLTYVAAPTVTSVTPNSGRTTGSTYATIYGSNFIGVTGVSIGGSSVQSSYVVNSSTSISVLTSPGTLGSSSVIVTTVGGSNAANSLFNYVLPIPSISSISPNTGPVSGNTEIVIHGYNFSTGPYRLNRVTFGGQDVVFTINSDVRFTFIAPSSAGGLASLVVYNDFGSATLSDAFTYIPDAPTVSAVSPNTGTTFGGTPITITGTNLTGASTVSINGVGATNVVAIARRAVRNHALAANIAHLSGFERFDEPVLTGHAPDPAIALYRHERQSFRRGLNCS